MPPNMRSSPPSRGVPAPVLGVGAGAEVVAATPLLGAWACSASTLPTTPVAVAAEPSVTGPWTCDELLGAGVGTLTIGSVVRLGCEESAVVEVDESSVEEVEESLLELELELEQSVSLSLSLSLSVLDELELELEEPSLSLPLSFPWPWSSPVVSEDEVDVFATSRTTSLEVEHV